MRANVSGSRRNCVWTFKRFAHSKGFFSFLLCSFITCLRIATSTSRILFPVYPTTVSTMNICGSSSKRMTCTDVYMKKVKCRAVRRRSRLVDWQGEGRGTNSWMHFLIRRKELISKNLYTAENEHASVCPLPNYRVCYVTEFASVVYVDSFPGQAYYWGLPADHGHVMCTLYTTKI